MEIDIQKPKRIVARLKYPVQLMNVGDSFFAPRKDQYSIWIGIRIRKEGEGIRVWRVY